MCARASACVSRSDVCNREMDFAAQGRRPSASSTLSRVRCTTQLVRSLSPSCHTTAAGTCRAARAGDPTIATRARSCSRRDRAAARPARAHCRRRCTSVHARAGVPPSLGAATAVCARGHSLVQCQMYVVRMSCCTRRSCAASLTRSKRCLHRCTASSISATSTTLTGRFSVSRSIPLTADPTYSRSHLWPIPLTADPTSRKEF